MSKIEKRHLAAAKRAAKRRKLKSGVPSVEVMHQKEEMHEVKKVPELTVPPKKASERQGTKNLRKSYSKKKDEHIPKEVYDAEES